MLEQQQKDQNKVNNNNRSHVDQPPFTGNSEDFILNITPAEIEATKNASGDIYIHKVIEYLPPRFEDTEARQQSLWKWQAARIMQNHMNYLILHHGFKSKYYNTYRDKKDELKVIEASHLT